MREKNLCKSRWSTYNKCTQWAIKSLEKYKIFSVKIDIRFFSPAFLAYCALYLLSLLCALLYTLWQNQKCMNWVQKDLLKIFLQVWTEMAKKNALQAVYEYRWQIYLHISKSVLIENYLLIEYFCDFFFLNSCENLQIRPQINS